VYVQIIYGDMIDHVDFVWT